MIIETRKTNLDELELMIKNGRKYNVISEDGMNYLSFLYFNYCCKKLEWKKEDETFTDSRALFEELNQEWLNTKLCCTAKEMGMDDILYEKVFKSLSKEKQSELIGRKVDFANMAGVNL